nr:immunoglobulin light chain junction region [Macaca mulatta]MOW30583.1 immunoglobulin light chain junction region [Macaca mulatta]
DYYCAIWHNRACIF